MRRLSPPLSFLFLSMIPFQKPKREEAKSAFRVCCLLRSIYYHYRADCSRREILDSFSLSAELSWEKLFYSKFQMAFCMCNKSVENRKAHLVLHFVWLGFRAEVSITVSSGGTSFMESLTYSIVCSTLIMFSLATWKKWFLHCHKTVFCVKNLFQFLRLPSSFNQSSNEFWKIRNILKVLWMSAKNIPRYNISVRIETVQTC